MVRKRVTILVREMEKAWEMCLGLRSFGTAWIFFASVLLLLKKCECPMTNPLVVAGFVREEVNTRTYNWGGGMLGGNAVPL